MFLDFSAVFPECRFSIPAPEFQRSVAKLISSLSHIPFGRSFSFQFAPQLVVSEKGRKLTPSASFLNYVCNDKKSRYTAHQISGRKSLAISLMKLCTGSGIQNPSCLLFSLRRQTLQQERRSRNLFYGGCFVFHFRYSVVDSAISSKIQYSIWNTCLSTRLDRENFEFSLNILLFV